MLPLLQYEAKKEMAACRLVEEKVSDVVGVQRASEGQRKVRSHPQVQQNQLLRVGNQVEYEIVLLHLNVLEVAQTKFS